MVDKLQDSTGADDSSLVPSFSQNRPGLPPIPEALVRACQPDQEQERDSLRFPALESPEVPSGTLYQRTFVPFSNREVTAYCDSESGLYGDSFTVPERAITPENFNWRSIDNITSAQLQHIYRITADYTYEDYEPIKALSATALASRFLLHTEQAQYVRATWDELQQYVDTIALLNAEANLQCVYRSREVTITCPDDGSQGASVTVPAGQFTSSISQEDADQQAVDYARSQLECLFYNETIVVACTDPEMGFQHPVATDPEGTVFPGGFPLRVGTYTVPAGTFSSSVSTEDANTQARSFGYDHLVCFYVNDEVTKNCSDLLGVPWDEIKDDLEVQPPKEVNGSPGGSYEQGQIVTVPKGSYRSEVSTEDANLIAETAAMTFLFCDFCSHIIYPTCVPQQITDALTDTDPATGLNTFERVLQDPNYYTGDDKDPLPLTEDKVAALSHYLFGAARKDYLKSITPMNATAGAPARLFCGPNGGQQDAESSAKNPIPTEEASENCFFVNKEIKYACLPVDGDPEVLAVMEGVTPENRQYVGKEIYPSDQLYITIPEYSYVVYVDSMDPSKGDVYEQARDAAQQMAQAAAISQMRCFWANIDMTFDCGDEYVPIEGYTDAPVIVNPDGSGNYVLPVFAEGYGSLPTDRYGDQNYPVIITAGMFTSTVNYGDVLNQVVAYAKSLIQCYYTNVEQSPDPCPPSTISAGGSSQEQSMDNAYSINVPAGTVLSIVSHEDADRQAKAQANAARICYYPADAQIGGGTPGADGQDGAPGSQTNCNGKCGCYYS